MSALNIDFAGTTRDIDSRLSFGREADLVLDEANKFMHRVCGEFEYVAQTWWLTNTGSLIRLKVFGENGVRIEVPPGTRCALPMPAGTVSLLAGPTPYEIEYQTEHAFKTVPAAGGHGTETIEFGVTLSPREAIYLATFAMERLRGRGTSLLTYAQVARIWSVSEKTIDNTLQRVRSRMRSSGVRDTETLESLIDHLIAHGQISASKLREIEHQNPGVL